MPITLTTPIVKNMPVPTLVSITKVDIIDVHFKVNKDQIIFRISLVDSNNVVRMYEDYTIEGEDYNTFITATNPTQKIGTSIKRLLLQYLTNKGIFSGTVSLGGAACPAEVSADIRRWDQFRVPSTSA